MEEQQLVDAAARIENDALNAAMERFATDYLKNRVVELQIELLKLKGEDDGVL